MEISLLLYLALVLNISAQQIHYVTPDALPPLTCPSQSCLTFDQCAQRVPVYFTTGSTFEFIPGYHSLRTSFNLSDVADLILRGYTEENGSNPDVNIITRNEVTILLENITNATIIGLNFFFGSDSSGASGSPTLFALNYSEVDIIRATFQGSGNVTILKRSLQAINSNIDIKNSSFKGNTAEIGGAIEASGSNIVLSGCSFIKNVGSTIHIAGSLLALKGTPQNRFTLNSSPYGGYGGALASINSTITLTGYNRFTKNSVIEYGGALFLYNSRVAISGITLFLKNRALYGGAIYFPHDSDEARQSALNFTSKQLYFIGNTAGIRGGAMMVESDSPQIDNKMLISGQFVNNTAGECGGAMYLSNMNVTTKNVAITGSRGTAICLLDSNILFTGITKILDNTGKLGGSIYSERSSIILTNNSLLQGNNASFGGAIYSVHGTGGGGTVFQSNRADADGGALYAINTEITLKSEVLFNYNSANRGGAMFFQQTASLLFTMSFKLTAVYNHADEYGGVIFHDDVATHVQCSHILRNSTHTFLPYCFIRLQADIITRLFFRIYIYMTNNTAGKNGDVLYGGLLDRCQVNLGNDFHYTPPYYWLLTLLKLPFPFVNELNSTIMTSQPYQLCFCENELDYNCLESQTRHVYRGQKLMVSILALDQTESTVATTIKALISSNARILPNQDPQALLQDCYTLIYNLYSSKSSEQLLLHPDGPCRDTELSQAVIYVTLLPCPDGFTESGDHCVCEERLQEYANCIIDDDIYIEKKSDKEFWMSAYYDENSIPTLA